MSVARTHTVQKARKDQGTCGHCGVALPAGSGYLWWSPGFRSRSKAKRCLKAACRPKPSERESSAAATPMAAIEEFEEQTFDTIDDLRSAWETVTSALEEYAQERESALDAWENGNSALEELRDTAQEASDEAQGWEPEDYPDEEPEADADEGSPEVAAYREHVEEQRQEAVDLASGLEL